MLNGGQCIGKGWQFLDIPGRLLDRQVIVPSVPIGQQGDHREQTEQGWCDAQDGEIRPLALGLHTQVSPGFVESDLDLPAPRKPLDDLLGRNGEIGTQQGLRLKPLLGIADNDPANRQGRLSAMEPDGGAGGDFNLTFLLAIPFLHSEPFPACAFVFRNLLQSRQASALFARAASLPRFIFGWLLHGCIQAKAHNHTNRVFELSQLPEQVNHGKTAVSHDHQQPFW